MNLSVILLTFISRSGNLNVTLSWNYLYKQKPTTFHSFIMTLNRMYARIRQYSYYTCKFRGSFLQRFAGMIVLRRWEIMSVFFVKARKKSPLPMKTWPGILNIFCSTLDYQIVVIVNNTLVSNLTL